MRSRPQNFLFYSGQRTADARTTWGSGRRPPGRLKTCRPGGPLHPGTPTALGNRAAPSTMRVRTARGHSTPTRDWSPKTQPLGALGQIATSGRSVLGPPARGPPAVTAATATGPTFPWASSLPPFLCSEARAEKATCRWKVTCSQPRLRTFPRRAGSSQGLGLLGLRIPKPLPSGRPERPPRG